MFLIRFSLIGTLFFLCACNNNCIDLEIDLSNQNIDVKVDHLETDLFSETTNSLSKHELLLKKYGKEEDLTKLFTNRRKFYFI